MKSIEVRIEDLTKKFGDVIAIDGISLVVSKGSLVTFLGPSGCGKTTTLRCVAGLEAPTAGRIYFDNRLMNPVPPYKRDVGFVFQNWALFPHLTVEKNIAFGLELRKVRKSEIKQRVEEALRLVRLEGMGKRLPSQLSGGQQQRVALARAIVINPQVLLLDEPLSNLDAKLRKEMRAELRLLHEELRITTIYVTHDQQEALTLSDKVVLMHRGKIQQIGTPVEIYNRPVNHFVAEFMGFENFLSATVKEIKQGEVEVLVELAEGRRLVLRGVPFWEGLRTGERVEVAIRAPHIKFWDGDPSHENIIEGTVEALLYQGDRTLYFIELPGGRKLNVIHEGPPLKNRMESVLIFLPPEKLTPIKEGGYGVG